MPYPIEVICFGENVYPHIERAVKTLNAVQSEFVFSTPSGDLKQVGLAHNLDDYQTTEVFKLLQDYRKMAGSHARI